MKSLIKNLYKVTTCILKVTTCILSLSSICKTKQPKKILIIFPEIGLNGTEYDDILPKNIHKIYLNIWTNQQFEKLKEIDNYQTKQLEYEKWLNNIIIDSRKQIINEMKKYNHTLPKTIFFSHSFGTIIADKLKDHADMIITYGRIIKKDNIKIFNLLGTEDNVVLSNYSYWPKNTIPLQDLNHYSCVTPVNKNKTILWNKSLNKYMNTSSKINEKVLNDDKRYVLYRQINWLINEEIY